MTPEPNHATASTRRTGTPSIAVISRSLASARIAVPSLLFRKNNAVPAVTMIGKAIADHLGPGDADAADRDVVGSRSAA